MARLSLSPSSQLASADYDDQTRTLTVTFLSGGTYRYSGVDSDTKAGLESAASPGSYLAENIKGRFPFTRA